MNRPIKVPPNAVSNPLVIAKVGTCCANAATDVKKKKKAINAKNAGDFFAILDAIPLFASSFAAFASVFSVFPSSSPYAPFLPGAKRMNNTITIIAPAPNISQK